MYLGRHTCLPWLAAGPGLESIPLLAEGGGAPPFVLSVGDRRRAARVLARLEDAVDLVEFCRRESGKRAGGRVALGIGRYEGAAVMVVETQMGGPATEILVREVLDESFHPSGAKAILRVGSCGTLGTASLAIAAFATGWSAAIEQCRRGVLAAPAECDADRPVRPPVVACSPTVVAALERAVPAETEAVSGGIYSKDSLYAEQDQRFANIMRDLGCVATEMELATIGPIAESMGVAWGGVMGTAGFLEGEAWLTPKQIQGNEDAAIETALEAVRILAS